MNKYLLGLLLLGYYAVIHVYAQESEGEGESTGESEGEGVDTSNVGDSSYFVDYFYLGESMEKSVPNPYPVDMCCPYSLDTEKYVKYECETNNLVMKYISTDSLCSNMTVDSWYFVNSSIPGDIHSFQCIGQASYIGLKAYCGLSNEKTILTVPGVCYFDTSNEGAVARWTCNYDDSVEYGMFSDIECVTISSTVPAVVYDSSTCEQLWDSTTTGTVDVNITIGTGDDFMCYEVNTRAPTSSPTESGSMMVSALVAMFVGSLSSLLQ